MTIALPALERSGESQERALRVPTPAEVQGLARTGLVLLVEDVEAAERVLRAALTRAGFNVVSAAGFAEAQSVAAQFGDEIDVIVADVGLPDGRGDALVFELRGVLPHARAVLMSGYDVPLRAVGAASGIVMLRKPFRPSELVAVVARLAAEAQAARDSARS